MLLCVLSDGKGMWEKAVIFTLHLITYKNPPLFSRLAWYKRPLLHSVLLMLGLIYTSCLKVSMLKVPLKDQGRSRRAEMVQLWELAHKNLHSYIGYSQGTQSFQESARCSQIRWGSASSSCLPELANTASLHHWQALCGLFLAETEFVLQEILEGSPRIWMKSIKLDYIGKALACHP